MDDAEYFRGVVERWQTANYAVVGLLTNNFPTLATLFVGQNTNKGETTDYHELLLSVDLQRNIVSGNYWLVVLHISYI